MAGSRRRVASTSLPLVATALRPVVHHWQHALCKRSAANCLAVSSPNPSALQTLKLCYAYRNLECVRTPSNPICLTPFPCSPALRYLCGSTIVTLYCMER